MTVQISVKNGMNCRFVKRIAAMLFSIVFWAVAGIATMSAIANAAFADDYNKETLIGVDFSGRDLRDASFTKANMRQSNLSHTDVRGVSFFGANLESANLEGADMREATLDTARCTRVNFTNAILEGGFAFNTKFEGAIIDGADFTDVLLREDAQKMLCKVAQGTNPVTGRNTRDTLLCD